jgi:hypothetical protein
LHPHSHCCDHAEKHRGRDLGPGFGGITRRTRRRERSRRHIAQRVGGQGLHARH